MEIHGFMARQGHGDHWWQSRDCKDIDCQAVGCLYNHDKKCMVPSRCQIALDGRCEGFEAKPLPKKIDGD